MIRLPQPYDMVNTADVAAVLAAVPDYWRPRIGDAQEFAAGLQATGYRTDIVRASLASRASDVANLAAEAVDEGLLALANVILGEDLYTRRGETAADALNRWVADRREWAEDEGTPVDADVAIAEAFIARPPRTLVAVFVTDIADDVSRATLRHVAALAAGDTDDFAREVASITRDGWEKAAKVWREVEAARSACAAA